MPASAVHAQPAFRQGHTIAVLPSLIALVLLALPSAVFAQASDLAGTVVAARSLHPLEGVEIRVVGTDLRIRTDAPGRFVFRQLTGPEVTLELRWLGYRPLTKTISVGKRTIRIVLIEVAVELDAIVVTGTPTGTEARAIGNDVGRIAAADVMSVASVMELQQLLN